MAEITVDCYDSSSESKPSGKVKITPRNNGYEWTVSNSGGLITKHYEPTFNIRNLNVNIIPGGYSGSDKGHLSGPFTFSNKTLLFKKDDALKLYDFFAEQMEWSPDALKSGTAHPDLLAAQQRHSATAATPSAGGGGGGGSRRKGRKTRKSRKSRK